MSAKAGAATAAINREQKHALGSSPNAVANKYLASLRDREVVITSEAFRRQGKLLAFDLYSLLIQEGGLSEPTLVFKGPGVAVHPR